MRDVTVRVQAEAALEESFGRIQTLVQSQRFGVVFEDEQERVVIANQAFCDMFSLAAGPEDCIGQPGSDLCGSASGFFLESKEFLEGIERLRATGEYDKERLYTLSDGRTIEVSGQLVGGVPLRGGLLLQYRDVTERQRAAEALEQATLEAEQANQAKSDFLAQMSHEIRTPLNALLGMTELLLHTELTDSQRAYAKSVFANSEVMLALINDVLDVSKIEGGGFELIEAPFVLRDLLEGVVESQAARLKAGVELYTVVDPRLPYRVSGDLTRVRQVLANLVSNAVKYTDSGEVALLARLPEDELGEHTVELVVRDTGVGITASEQEKIFDKYGQTSKSLSLIHI